MYMIFNRTTLRERLDDSTLRLLTEAEIEWVAGGTSGYGGGGYGGPEIVVVGKRYRKNVTLNYWYFADSPDPGYGYDYDEDGSRGAYGEMLPSQTNPPPPPTIDQLAEQFANKAVEHGPGFDPNNPAHLQIEARIKQDLQQAYKSAHDGTNSTARLTNGSNLTDVQMHSIINGNLHVTLQTSNIVTGSSGDYLRANDDNGVLNHYITLDLDHSNFATLTNNFGSRDEAFSFTLGHELGHAFDREFRGTGGTSEEREAYANFYAFELGNAFGLTMPTRAEVIDSGYTIYEPSP